MRRLFKLLTLVSAFTLAACAAPTPGTDHATPAQPTAAAPESAQTASAPALPAVPGESVVRDTLPAEPQPRTKPAPPMSDPLPPERVRDAQPSPRSPPGSASARGAAGKVDLSCKSNADCTVKNVGNCCGAYPACVNVNSRTDPEGVKAQCAASGMASVCGFAEINGCQCVQGQCQADSGAVAQ